MRKIISIILVVFILVYCSGCNVKESKNENEETKSKIALVCNFIDAQEESAGYEIYNSMVEYYSNENHPARKYHPQSDSVLHIIQAIESAIIDGYNVISVIGDNYGNAVSSIASQYPHIKFVIFGMSDAIALHNNVYCCNLDTDYLVFYNSILK